MRGFLLAAVWILVAAASSGCVSFEADIQERFGSSIQSKPVGPVESFHVDQTFESLGREGVDETWTWSVNGTNFTTYRIQVAVTGPDGADVYNAQYRCVEAEGGEDGGNRHVQRNGNCGSNNTGVGLSFSSAGTMYDYDGAESSVPLGPWSLRVAASPGAYEIRVLVDLTY